VHLGADDSPPLVASRSRSKKASTCLGHAKPTSERDSLGRVVSKGRSALPADASLAEDDAGLPIICLRN
jgi:hypothetical protein